MTCRGNLAEAYEIGLQLTGGAREVLNPWLEEVKDRLRLEDIMKRIQKHLKAQGTYFDKDL